MHTLAGPPWSRFISGRVWPHLLFSHFMQLLCSVSFDTEGSLCTSRAFLFTWSLRPELELVFWTVFTNGSWTFLLNWLAAARAPAMAAVRLDDFSTSDAFSGNCIKTDPGFKEKRLRGFGRGNFTGIGPLTGASPLTAASYICQMHNTYPLLYLHHANRRVH